MVKSSAIVWLKIDSEVIVPHPYTAGITFHALLLWVKDAQLTVHMQMVSTGAVCSRSPVVELATTEQNGQWNQPTQLFILNLHPLMEI